jgi:DNA-binding transcriptional regulator of glucitol operon
MHVAIAVVVPTFLALFWWQVQRVREGNTLSWAYVFEWPFFTGYAIYMWWKLVHDRTGAEPHGAGAATRTATPAEPGEDEELTAYNRYLAELHASGRRKRW